jgi:HEAT repeat protein
MPTRRIPTWTVVLSLLFVSASARGAFQPPTAGPEDPELVFLKASGIATEGQALLDYLQKFSGNDDALRHVDEFVRQLGSARFAEREAATAKLIQLGPATLTALRRALTHPDAEVVRRVQECTRKIEASYAWTQQRAVVRLLLRRTDSAAVEALIRFLPYTADEGAEADIWFGLYASMKGRPELLRLLPEYLDDPLPARRALAGCLLGRLGDETQKKSARRLVKDLHPQVRLRTAQGLLGAQDATGVPALIDLLDEPAVEFCWSAEELLFWLAGDGAPNVTVGAATEESCRRSRDAWRGWWEKHRGKIDWQDLASDGHQPGLLLICDQGKWEAHSQPKFKRIWLCGCDAKPRWQITRIVCARAQLLIGNRLLLLDTSSKGGHSAQRDLLGKVLWESENWGWNWMLPNGKVLIGAWLQLGPDGTRIETKDQKHPESVYIEHLYSEVIATVPRLRDDTRLFTCWRPAVTPEERISPFVFQPSPCVLRVAADGQIVSVTRIAGTTSVVRDCLELVRLGFDFPPRRELDLTAILSQLMKDPNPEARYWALTSLLLPLGQKGAKHAQLILEAIADADPNVRGVAQKAVNPLGAQASSALIRALDDPREQIREAAYSGLVACKKDLSRESIQTLLEYFIARVDDSDSEKCRLAVNALGHFGPRDPARSKGIARILTRKFENGDRSMRWTVVWSLDKFRLEPDICVPFLLGHLRNKYDETQSQITLVLGIYAHDDRVYTAMLNLLTKGDEKMQASAAAVIAARGVRAKVHAPAIFLALKRVRADDPYSLHITFMNALVKIGAEAADLVPVLTDILSNKSCQVNVRAFAAQALGELGGHAKMALPALQDIARDNYHTYLVECANRAIKAIQK